MDKEKILQTALNGDRNSQSGLIELVKDKIFNIAVYYTGDFHLAQDCTQEILLKIISSLHKLKEAQKFENWAYTITSNYLRNYYRDNKKYTGITLEAMEAESTMHLEKNYAVHKDYSEEKEFIYELKVSCTTAMLMCLSKDDRVLLILSMMLELNSLQISEILDVSPEVVRKRLSRANTKIKNFIKNNCGLLNKENSCICRQRVNYAIAKGRVSVEDPYFLKKQHIENQDVLRNKMDKMEELAGISEIFKNNPEYTISAEVLEKVYNVSKN